jgi:pimeloyl-ACP methyl ester carboxylesterase/DNA-binding winged helix-turn-helix (wHTH) protein
MPARRGWRFIGSLLTPYRSLFSSQPACAKVTGAQCLWPGKGKLLYLFEDYVLDPERRELRRGATFVPLAPQAFDLLEYLIRNRNRVLSKDDLIASIWHGRIVSESALSTRINAARAAVGDTGVQQRLIKTLPRKGLRFVGVVREDQSPAAVNATGAATEQRMPSMPDLVQQIRFCVSRDGTRIAYATCGAGPPLVLAAHFTGHLKVEWESPVWRPWIEMLARRHTLVRYDGRGCGLSDREGIEFSLNKGVEDLDSVIEATQVKKFALLGISSGGAIAMTYAALHPERINHLILYGAYTRGRMASSTTPEQREDAELQIKAIQVGWGQENPVFRQLYTFYWIPDATVEQSRSFNELIRQSTTPANATKLLVMAFNFDLGDSAIRVRCPTLVLHARDDAVVPFEEGRALAGLISGARFVPLESRNHLLLEKEPAFLLLAQEIEGLLADADGPRSAHT